MPSLNSQQDFQDDGGTRAWRNNQATYGPVYETVKPAQAFWSGAAGNLAKLAVACAAFGFFLLFFLLVLVVVGGIFGIR